MRGVPADIARSLIDLGVSAALNAVGDTKTDRRAIVDSVMLSLLARTEQEKREKRAPAAARHKAKDPDAYRARNLEAVKRSRARRKEKPDA